MPDGRCDPAGRWAVAISRAEIGMELSPARSCGGITKAASTSSSHLWGGRREAEIGKKDQHAG
ncbi:unnamed protein product [Ectocarpus sp. CCAP 1310/34]|nr:unnamed protein product [Ectocarpus sp. CCAP 1310/34]